MYSELNLKKQVMTRIYFISSLRKILSPLGLKATGVLMLFLMLQFSISMGDIISNLINVSKKFSDIDDFILGAFLNTGLLVQAISLAIVLLIIFFARDLYKGFSFSNNRFRTTT